MEYYRENQIGIDLLCEISIGWHITNFLEAFGYYVAKQDDGVTPVNIINSFSLMDDRKTIVLRKDYTNKSEQIPLPIVCYDLVGDSNTAIELGSGAVRMNYMLGFLVHAENKVQATNLAGFIKTILIDGQIPIYNYNVNGNPSIGVIQCENVITTRMYDMQLQTDISEVFSISISCDAIAEFTNRYLS